MRILFALTLALGVSFATFSPAEEVEAQVVKQPKQSHELETLVAKLASQDAKERDAAVMAFGEIQDADLFETVKLLVEVNRRGIFTTNVRQPGDQQFSYAFKPTGCEVGWLHNYNGYLGAPGWGFYGTSTRYYGMNMDTASYGQGWYGIASETGAKKLQAAIESGAAKQEAEVETSIKASETVLLNFERRLVEPLIAMYGVHKDDHLLQLAAKLRISPLMVDKEKGEEQLAARRRLYHFLSEAYLEKAKDNY